MPSATNGSNETTQRHVMGFVGLGNMGHGMAKNLRSRLPNSSRLVICDVVAERRDAFMDESKGTNVLVAHTPRGRRSAIGSSDSIVIRSP